MAARKHGRGPPAPEPESESCPPQAGPDSLPDHLTPERYTFALDGLCEVNLMLGVIWRERYRAGFDVLLPAMLSRARETMCLAMVALADPSDDLETLRRRFYHRSLLTGDTELHEPKQADARGGVAGFGPGPTG